MFEFKKTDWAIQGSSGVTVTGGTPTIRIQLGGGYLRLPIKKFGTKDAILLRGRGLGFSGGAALEFPWSDWINISGSFDFFPSTGLGPIFQKAENNPAYTERDLTGHLLVIAANGAVSFKGGSLAVCFWLNHFVEQCLVDIKSCSVRATVTSAGLKIVPGSFPVALLYDTHAIGFFTGFQFATDAGSVTGSAFHYKMSL